MDSLLLHVGQVHDSHASPACPLGCQACVHYTWFVPPIDNAVRKPSEAVGSSVDRRINFHLRGYRLCGGMVLIMAANRP